MMNTMRDTSSFKQNAINFVIQFSLDLEWRVFRMIRPCTKPKLGNELRKYEYFVTSAIYVTGYKGTCLTRRNAKN